MFLKYFWNYRYENLRKPKNENETTEFQLAGFNSGAFTTVSSHLRTISIGNTYKVNK